MCGTFEPTDPAAEFACPRAGLPPSGNLANAVAAAAARVGRDSAVLVPSSLDGLKTLDAVSGRLGPSATVPASSKAVREALAGRAS